MSNKLHAEQILNNPLFINIVNSIESKLFAEWKDSTCLTEREAIFIRLEALRGLAAEINEHLVRTINE